MNEQLRDLGLLLDTKMTYTNHVHIISNTEKINLGLIPRHAKYFRNTTALRISYYTLVRSHFDHNCLIWDLSTQSTVKTIERAQKIFLRSLYYRDFTYIDRSISYGEITEGYEITTI